MTNEDIQNLFEQIYAVLATYGLNVIGALAIIVIGFIAAGWARRALERALSRSGHVDATIVRFFGSLLRYAIIAFVVIAALQRFGVEATSLVAVFGAAGLAIGLALQGTLSNVAAGVMLLMFRPFKIGDFVEAGGVTGVIDEIGILVTKMHTPDNKGIIVPNSQVMGGHIVNFNAHETRRCDMVFGIGYSDDIDKAKAKEELDAAEEDEPLCSPASTTSSASSSSVPSSSDL